MLEVEVILGIVASASAVAITAFLARAIANARKRQGNLLDPSTFLKAGTAQP